MNEWTLVSSPEMLQQFKEERGIFHELTVELPQFPCYAKVDPQGNVTFLTGEQIDQILAEYRVMAIELDLVKASA